MPQRPLQARDAVTARPKQPDAAFRAAVRFRTADETDVPAVVPMINAAYLRESHLLPGPRIDPDRLLAELRQPDTQLILAETGGVLAGSVRLITRDDRAYFGLLATDPALQGRGLASMLIDHVERKARDAGFDALYLQCVKELGLPPFYASLGYSVITEIPGVTDWGALRPWTKVEMKKALA
ncbi:MAG: GNAT family N-acetyltransferase [Chloroflexi bacterium]|nr:GNAT family N-acetyltransferase [Chloroflexota bacterium]